MRARPATMDFYGVYHTFKAGREEEWWAQMSEMDMDAFAKTNHADGIYAHNFLPAAIEGPILCVWETKEKTTPVEFQTFIDGFTGDALVNEVYKIEDGAFTPESAWPTMPAKPKPTTGAFFWVNHSFKRGQADKFFASLADFDADAFAEANEAKGFCNHYFLPTGATKQDPVFCVWESKEDMSIEEFQNFIDGPDGPGPDVFNNVVHKVMPGGNVPSAAFSASASPFDDIMSKIEELLPLKMDDIVAKIKDATKSLGA